MPRPCPECREPFAAHFAVRARCRVRWRGASFDAQAAKGAIGIAVLDALGWSAREAGTLDRLQDRVRIEAYRAVAPDDLNPHERIDPNEGEWWEFHVGFRSETPPSVVEDATRGVVSALARARNYERAAVVEVP